MEETAVIKGYQEECIDEGFPVILCFSPNKRHMSAISLSTQQYMISIVNTDCYKSPPVQTRTLFAKLLTPAFEDMTVCGS